MGFKAGAFPGWQEMEYPLYLGSLEGRACYRLFSPSISFWYSRKFPIALILKSRRIIGKAKTMPPCEKSEDLISK